MKRNDAICTTISLIAIGFFLPAVAPAAKADTAESGSCSLVSDAPPAVEAALDDLLARTITHPVIPAPAAVLSVRTQDWRYVASAGFADPDTDTPMDCSAPYQIGSATKMMIAAVVLQLAEEGRLGIDDPLSMHLPTIASRIPNGDAVTLRHLLQHTSGIFSYTDNAPDGTPGVMEGAITDRTAIGQPATPSGMIDFVVEHGEPQFMPGADGAFSYSNTGYVLLGMVIEALERRPVGKSLETRIFGPLGMHQTFLWNDVPRPAFGLARAFLQAQDNEMTNWNMSQGWAAGGVISTVDDMHVFIEALVRGDLFQSAETLQSMQQTFLLPEGLAAPLPLEVYGLGLQLVYQGYLGDLWGHGGQTLGYASMTIAGDGVSIISFGTTSTNLMAYPAGGVSEALRSAGVSLD